MIQLEHRRFMMVKLVPLCMWLGMASLDRVQQTKGYDYVLVNGMIWDVTNIIPIEIPLRFHRLRINDIWPCRKACWLYGWLWWWWGWWGFAWRTCPAWSWGPSDEVIKMWKEVDDDNADLVDLWWWLKRGWWWWLAMYIAGNILTVTVLCSPVLELKPIFQRLVTMLLIRSRWWCLL